MNKKLILVAAPPACGKTYVSKKIANAVNNMVYLDKDDLSALVRACFSIGGKALDMDGDFYKNNIRTAEYKTLMDIALSALRFNSYVLVNAPFGKEIRDTDYIKDLKEKANKEGSLLLLIWVTAPLDVCFERMKKRNSDRDALKLKDWDNYVKKINYNPPYELEKSGAVDQFMIFDTRNPQTQETALDKVLKMILEENNA